MKPAKAARQALRLLQQPRLLPLQPATQSIGIGFFCRPGTAFGAGVGMNLDSVEAPE